MVHQVTLIHDTHTLGNFGGPIQNIAKKAFVIRRIQSEHPGALFLGLGDDLGTSVLSHAFHGSHMVAALSLMGLHVNAVANHDLDESAENLFARAAESPFPWVSANLRHRSTGEVFGAAAGVKPFVLLDSGYVRVGVTALAPEDTPDLAVGSGSDLTVLPYVEALQKVVPVMRAAGAQLVVVLAHICWNDAEELALNLPGLMDVMLGDHCAGVLRVPKVVGNTIIARAGDEHRFVGQLTLSVSGGRVVDWSYQLHPIVQETPEEPQLVQLVHRYEAALDPALSEVVGQTFRPLLDAKPDHMVRETALGSFIAEVARSAVGADCAVINGGSIRAELIPAGPVTLRYLTDAVPFRNSICKLEVDGTTLLAVLAHGLNSMDRPDGQFPQVAGLQLWVDPLRPAGERICRALIRGHPIEPGRAYTVAVSDYMATGNAGFGMLKAGRILNGPQGGPDLVSELVLAVRHAGTIHPRVEGRVLLMRGVTFQAGWPEINICGWPQPLESAPVWHAGQLCLPLRSLVELYGGELDWDGNRSVRVQMVWGQPVLLSADRDAIVVSGEMMIFPGTVRRLGFMVDQRGAHLQIALPLPEM